MTALADRIETFRSRLHQRLSATAGESPAVVAEADALHALWAASNPADPFAARPATRPACAFLPEALAVARTGGEAALAEAIEALVPDLAWTYGYSFNSRRPDLGDRIAFAQILGQGGLGHAPRLLAGLTLIAPHTYYPLHAHPAIELYLVISGTALWRSGAAEPRPMPAGSFIFHPTNVPHATEATAEPLLALYTWRGDLNSPSVFLPDLRG